MNGLSKENMIKMTKKLKVTINLVLAMLVSISAWSQCNSWVELPNKDEAETFHVVYRDAFKAKDYDLAFENWQKAFELAPAADGKRSSHFFDGIELYKNLLKNETDEAKKKEYKEKVGSLYTDLVECYKSKGITFACKDDACLEKKIGYALGRQGADMYYYLNSPYSKNLDVFKESFRLAGVESEYIIFDPMARIAVYQFQKEKLTKEEVIAIYEDLETIADYNVENNEKLGDYYQQAWDAAKGQFAVIERDIFDCEYFKVKYQPELNENPDDPETAKKVFNYLKALGCDANDPLLVKLKGQYEAWASEVNAQKKAEFEQNNPAFQAKKLYDAGDFKGAAAKYEGVIAQETDPSKKAGYMFSLASIEFRKLKKYSQARKTALAAAKLRPNWGRPYVLIGDMYGTGARSCGDSWNQRLAILAAMDKYSYAKSIDPSVADEVNGRLSKYRASMPEQTEGFMRGIKKGDSATVGCWIGEKVKVRYK